MGIVASLDLLVDISRLDELRNVERTGHGLEIGACVTYDELDHSDEVRAALKRLDAMEAGHDDRIH